MLKDKGNLSLPAGVPARDDYYQLLKSDLFRQIEECSDKFLRDHSFLKDQYSWVKDPFHQWSRQWEYPFVFSSIVSRITEQSQNSIRILDAGSGITFFPYLLAETVSGSNVTCCDADQALAPLFEQVNHSRKTDNVRFDAVDLRSLPYSSSSFDVAYCISVLEHTRDYADIVREFARVIAPGGVLVLSFDLALDGVSNICCEEAELLLASLKTHFYGPQDTHLCEQDYSSAVTAVGMGEVDKNLLPWRYPRLSLIKSAMAKRKLPKALSKNLTVYCGTFFKES